MSKVLPAYAHDTMMGCSRKLFNAASDGDTDYALAVMHRTIETLKITMTYLTTGEGEANGNN
jgi:hypothetical protein